VCRAAPGCHVATRCNTLQRTASHCNILQRRKKERPVGRAARGCPVATRCNVLQRTASHCNALQCREKERPVGRAARGCLVAIFEQSSGTPSCNPVTFAFPSPYLRRSLSPSVSLSLSLALSPSLVPSRAPSLAPSLAPNSILASPCRHSPPPLSPLPSHSTALPPPQHTSQISKVPTVTQMVHLSVRVCVCARVCVLSAPLPLHH